MQDLPLFPSDYKRLVAKEPLLPLKNRFAEQNPTLNDSQVTLISRPALRKLAEAGEGHVRKVYNQAGCFDSDAFVVSGNQLFRLSHIDASITLIGTISTDPRGDVSMAATAPIGDVPSYLFIAEGQVLWVYTDDGHARSQLEATGAIADNDTVQIDGVYYRWTSGSVDAGTPDGSSGNPWLIEHTGTVSIDLQNLYYAITANGDPGTTYTTVLTEHPTCEVVNYTATDLFVQFKEAGVNGNGKSTTVVTGANLSWTSATLTGGGDPQLLQVTMPDDAGAISVTHINSYVIVVPVQSDALETIGRFYWVEPGEMVVDPLNFATAERSPDRINQAITFSDMFWLFGDTTVEPWVTTGDPAAPMQRFQGIIFDRGAWEGTAIKVRDQMIVVDEEGGVFSISNGQRRISTPAVEERIRRSIQKQGRVGA